MDKTKAPLVSELQELRQRVAELEASQGQRKQAEEALKESEERYRAELLNDIAERKRAQEALGYRIEFENLISTISTRFITLPRRDTDQGIDDTLEEIGRFAGTDSCYVCLFSDDKTRFSMTHLWRTKHVTTEKAELQNLDATSMPWWMDQLMRSEPVVSSLDELPADAAIERSIMERQGVQAVINVPMVSEGEIIGFLGFSSVRAQRQWTHDEVSLLTMVGEIITNTLKRKHAEEEIRKAKESYDRITDNADEVIFIVEAEGGHIVYANPAAERLFGYSQAEWLADPDLGFKAIHPDFAEKQRQIIEEINASKKPIKNTVLGWIAKDGREVLVEHTVVPVTDDEGNITHFESIGRDITERKRAEDELRKLNAEQQLIFDSVPAMIWYKDLENRVLRVNRAGAESVGMAVEEIEGKSAYDLFPNEAEKYYQDDLEVMETGKPKLGIIEHLQTASGEMLWVSTDKVLLRDENGDVTGLIAFVIDITERKRAEDALRASEEEKALILNNLAESVTYQDRDLRIVWANRAAGESVDAAPEDLVGRHCHEIWHQDSEPCTGCPVVKAMETGQPQEGEMTEPSGRVVHIRGYPVRDESGEVIGVVEVTLDVTERKQAEEALEEERNLLRTLIDSIPDHIYVKDAEGRFVLNNTTHLRHLGAATQDDVLGKTDFDLSPRELAAQYHADEQKIFRSARPLVNKEEMTQDQEGNEQWVSTTKVPTTDSHGRTIGIVGISRDITERKRAEKALKASEEQYRTIVETAEEGVWMIDSEAKTAYANQRLAEMLGYTVQEMLGRSLFDFMDDPVREQAEHLFSRRKSGAREQHDFRFQRRDGSDLWAIVSTNPLFSDDGTFRGALGMLTDITERKQAEEEKRSLEAQVQHAQKLESLGVLAGGIAHDFNNILLAILGNADLALRDLSEVSPARPSIEEIEKAARRAAGLTRQMLAYTGKGQFEVAALDLGELVEEMTHLLKSSISKKVTLRINLSRGLSAIKAGTAQIQQIVMNLITNASEAFGEEESGVVTISTGEMECTGKYLSQSCLPEKPAEGDYIYLEVSDTGCGMDEETRAKLFDPFFTTKFSGRGLGMSAVLGIVGRHHGAIMVDSERGIGTTVKVLFPAFPGQAEKTPGEGASPKPEEWSGKGTLLLVDDEEAVRDVGARMLRRMGFEVLTASDGLEAVELYREHLHEIVSVVLDLSMPHMDGEQTFHELRLIDGDVRVILSSGYTEQDIEDRFVGQGIAAFIQKPYQLRALREKLRQVLE